MNNQEICRFVNSKDIKHYLLEINYEFSTAEAAWLVYQCRTATLDEKIMAWKDIVNTMADQAIDSPQFDEPYESIHKVILDFIDLKEQALKLFLTESEKDFYQYTLVYSDGSMDYEDSMLYSSYEKCLKQMNKEIQEEKDDTVSGDIRRSGIDSFWTITAFYNNNAEIIDVRIPRDYGILDWNLLDFFEDLWFHFPVPYKKGDILYDPRKYNRGSRDGLIVMTGITPLLYEEDGRTHTDSSDMNVWGYFQEEETGILYQEVTWNYMDYELFPKEKLVGKKRILKALSNLLKEEISLDLFIRAYHLIILEETRNDLMPRGWYTDEGLKLAGIWDGKGSFSEKMFANEATES
jgi:hypothetical protein